MRKPEVISEFQEVGQLLWQAGLISSHGGNMSVRLPNGGTLITRHGSMLGRLEHDDFVLVSAEGAVDGDPSMDTGLHLAIYAAQPEARAVIHAHPRHAIALSLAAPAIRPLDLEGKHYLGDTVHVVGHDGIAAALKTEVIAVAEGHGCYARGQDLWRALQWTSVLEESSEVLYLARKFGQ